MRGGGLRGCADLAVRPSSPPGASPPCTIARAGGESGSRNGPLPWSQPWGCFRPEAAAAARRLNSCRLYRRGRLTLNGYRRRMGPALARGPGRKAGARNRGLEPGRQLLMYGPEKLKKYFHFFCIRRNRDLGLGPGSASGGLAAETAPWQRCPWRPTEGSIRGYNSTSKSNKSPQENEDCSCLWRRALCRPAAAAATDRTAQLGGRT